MTQPDHHDPYLPTARTAPGRAAQRACAAALAAGLLALPSLAAEDQVTWDLSTWGNPRAVTTGIEEIAKYVHEKSDGNFTINVHYGEAISPSKENLDGVKIGAFQMGHFCPAFHPDKTPALTVLDLPFLPFPDLDVQQAVHEAIFAHPVVQEEMSQWNATPYFSALLPQSEFMGSGKAPSGAEDFEGMRVVAPGATGDMVKNLGGVPTSVTSPEAYTALDRGTVQAVLWPFSYAMGAYRLHEVADWYTTGAATGAVVCPVAVNRDAYGALPEEYKALLQEAKEPAYERMKQAFASADEEWVPKFREAGLKEVALTSEEREKFVAAGAQPVWDKWVADMSAKGVPAEEMLETVLDEAEKARAAR